jgi:CBS domain-containing protein
VQEYVDFLGRQSPYDRLSGHDLECLAQAVEVEYVSAGTVVVAADAAALTHLWVVRTGAVTVLDRGRVVDRLTPGDTFGHVSLLSGLPPVLSVRAELDCVLYRLPDPRPKLAHPDRLQFHGYGMLAARPRMTDGGVAAERARAAVERHTRPVVLCQADTPIRQLAAAISAEGQSCAVVAMGDTAGWGIVTDADIRRHVGTGAVGVDEPAHRITTVPVLTVSAEASLAQAHLSMVEHGVHHLVVTDAAGRPAGVVRAVDLASAEVRDPLVVRAAIEAATDLDALATAARLLPTTIVELVDSGVPALRVSALVAAVHDALLRRVIALVPPDPAIAASCSWLVLGSLARREVLPASDTDTALVWRPDDPDGPYPATEDPEVDAAMRAHAVAVLHAMAAVGLQRCPDGANADNPRFGRSLSAWRAATRQWLADASVESAMLLSTMLADSRPITGLALGRAMLEPMVDQARSPQFLSALLDYTLSARPPTGFVRDFVVEHSGEHKGELNLKRGGLRPVTSIGRWAAMVLAPVAEDGAGSTLMGMTTPQRLQRAAQAGLLSRDEADSLTGAFEQISELLLEQEAADLAAGRPLSAYVAPGELDGLTRRHLRESFRVIASVQSRLEASLHTGRVPGADLA